MLEHDMRSVLAMLGIVASGTLHGAIADAKVAPARQPGNHGIIHNVADFSIAPTVEERVRQSQAARWGLGEALDYGDGSNPDAISVRWRLNKMKMRVPFSMR
jgi:hypothetical protein